MELYISTHPLNYINIHNLYITEDYLIHND
jgi:hypothetical protein